jgi:hypothetical protein
MTDALPPNDTVEARLAAYGLKAGPETLAALKTAVADLDAAAVAVRVPRSYLQEPVHALRLWTTGSAA